VIANGHTSKRSSDAEDQDALLGEEPNHGGGVGKAGLSAGMHKSLQLSCLRERHTMIRCAAGAA